ncbi:MAG TPA: DNA-directed RNA polymerase subunit alpha C-terminal domain-containing protein [Anaerolineaceae bacterium]|nr:DNA-directed RNA polymerase subunit alpha C-terminal domain-containing protein [Anaerolineaceae bacterium]
MQARQSYVDLKKARESERTSMDKPISELNLGTRATEALNKAGITTIGQVIDSLSQGEAGLLKIEGFGRKSLIDLKKQLRVQGYELPKAAEEITV